jgi:hypothetical protein
MRDELIPIYLPFINSTILIYNFSDLFCIAYEINFLYIFVIE